MTMFVYIRDFRLSSIGVSSPCWAIHGLPQLLPNDGQLLVAQPMQSTSGRGPYMNTYIAMHLFSAHLTATACCSKMTRIGSLTPLDNTVKRQKGQRAAALAPMAMHKLPLGAGPKLAGALQEKLQRS